MKGLFFIKKIIILILFAFLIITINNDNNYVAIPSTSIRMRVIAQSNSDKDQNDKKIIKSALEEKIYEVTEKAKNYEEANGIIEDNIELIDNYIANVAKINNINVKLSSNYGYNYFPEKEFKGLTYKSGNYKSYVVTLGDGKGDNWWCVLFPPICKIDESVSDYEYHFLIKDVLNKYN